MDNVSEKAACGPSEISDGGYRVNAGAVFTDVDGYPIHIASEGVLSARPNANTANEDGEPYVVLVWLKGHRRPVAVQSTWRNFVDAVLG